MNGGTGAGRGGMWRGWAGGEFGGRCRGPRCAAISAGLPVSGNLHAHAGPLYAALLAGGGRVQAAAARGGLHRAPLLRAAEIMVNTGQGLPQGHPFHGKIVGHDQGLGVEIGLVVPDPAAAREAALKFPGWSVTGLYRQPWGETDFRVSTPDGYYFRLTEPAR